MKRKYVFFLSIVVFVSNVIAAPSVKDLQKQIADLQAELQKSEDVQKAITGSLIRQFENVNVTIGAIISQPDFVSGDYYIMDADVSKGTIVQSGFCIVTDYNSVNKTAKLSTDSYIKDEKELKAKIEIIKDEPQVSWSSNKEIAGGVDVSASIVKADAKGTYDELYIHNIEKIAEISFNNEVRDNDKWIDAVIELYLAKINIYLLKYSPSIPQDFFVFSSKFPMIETAVLYKTDYQQCVSTSISANMSVGEIVSLNGKYYQKRGSKIIKNYIKIGLVDPAGLWKGISDKWTNAVAKQWQNTQRLETLFVGIDESQKKIIIENYKLLPDNMKSSESEAFIMKIDPTYRGININGPVIEKIIGNLNNDNKIIFSNLYNMGVIKINYGIIQFDEKKYNQLFKDDYQKINRTILKGVQFYKPIGIMDISNYLLDSIRIELK